MDLNQESDGSPLLPHPDSDDRLGGRILVINNTGGTLTVQPSSNRSTNTYSYSYAYGPKGLPGLLHNRYAFLCAFFASIGGLEFGYDQGVVSALSPFHRLYTTYSDGAVDCERVGDEGLYGSVAFDAIAKGNHE